VRRLLIQYKVRNVSNKKEVFNKILQCYNFVSSCLRRSEGSTISYLRKATNIPVGREFDYVHAVADIPC
jgi:hypothetical protein